MKHCIKAGAGEAAADAVVEPVDILHEVAWVWALIDLWYPFTEKTAESARAIRAEGFRDSTDYYGERPAVLPAPRASR